MVERAVAITTADDEERLTLWVRLPADRDFFMWGPISDVQRATLDEIGLFDLTAADQHGASDV